MGYQLLHSFPERVGFSHVSGENHIRDTGKTAAGIGFPHRDTGADLPHYIGTANLQGFHADITGGDSSFRYNKGRFYGQVSHQTLHTFGDCDGPF